MTTPRVSPMLVPAVLALAVPVATALLVRSGVLAARPTSARRNAAWFVLVVAAFVVAPGGLGVGAVVLSVVFVALFEATLAGLRSGPFRNHFR